MRTDVLIIPALLTWVVMTIGLMVFVHANPSYSDTRIHALGYGMLLGGCMYAVYDLTNYATLKGRSWQVMLMDIAWGCVLSGIVSVIMWWLK